jgi:hypothetical protein
MSEQRKVRCPEGGELTGVDRREFMKGVSTAALAAHGVTFCAPSRPET